MAVSVRYLTDPACVWSWTSEPALRRLVTEFGDELSFTYVMGGLARDFAAQERGDLDWLVAWLGAAGETGMAIDPRMWSEGPITSSYPACMAVKAAAQQASDGGAAYLRALREGLLCFRRKLDTTEALVEEARRVGLDVERFRIDLGSHGTVEAFGADLDEVRDVPDEARRAGDTKGSGAGERGPFPTFLFFGPDGARHGVYGPGPYEELRAAAEAAGARPTAAERPDVLGALRRFGRMADREVEAVCDLAEPVAAAELWRLARDWKVRPTRVLTGHLWEPA